MSATASLSPSTWCSPGCSPAPRWRPPTSKSVSCYSLSTVAPMSAQVIAKFPLCNRIQQHITPLRGCLDLELARPSDISLSRPPVLKMWWSLSSFRVWSQHCHCAPRWSSDHRELPSEAVPSLNLGAHQSQHMPGLLMIPTSCWSLYKARKRNHAHGQRLQELWLCRCMWTEDFQYGIFVELLFLLFLFNKCHIFKWTRTFFIFGYTLFHKKTANRPSN